MSRNQITTLNPADESPLETYAIHSAEEITKILSSLRASHLEWKRSSFSRRADVLREVSRLLRREKKALAELMQKEMGKKLEDGIAEVEKCADCASYYANGGENFLRPEEIPTEARRSFVAFEPLGTVLAIMPWNFPLWQVFRCALPAIFAGNTVALKHASNVTGCGLAAEKIWREATGGLELFRTLVVPGDRALDLVEHPEVSAVSFTGSTSVGKRIAAAAGALVKKCVMELGGSDPYVVLADADLEKAAEVCAKSRLINGGQSCISAKRFIVDTKVRLTFESHFLERLRAAGPILMARKDLRDELHHQVTRSISAGAKLRCGGELPSGKGAFYPATLLSDVTAHMPAFQEELFGPVAALIEAEDEADAIRLANQSHFGLGASVFTQDHERGLRIAEKELIAGACFVNDFVRSDPRLPFGGVKESGFGRELSSFGIREFVNIKTVYVAK